MDEHEEARIFTKLTRPTIARRAAWATFAYALLMAGAQLAGHGPGPDALVIGALFSPALGYMGARTVDAFSKNGKG